MKIDTTGIENYENMTPEEKVAALEGLDLPEAQQTDNGEVTRLKNALNKASSDVARFKKSLQEKMTQEEQDAAARKEAQEKMEEELNALRTEKAIAGYKNKYLKMGYSDELAESTAKALHSGDMETVFANQETFLDGTKKALQAAAINQQPGLASGKPMSAKDIEDEMTRKLFEAAGLR